MSWLSSLFKAPKPDAAYTASQKASGDLMARMATGGKLPALPKLTATQQGMGGMPAINPNPVGLPAYLGSGQNTTFPVGLPNQLSMIANQLSAGGYGAPDAIQNQMTGAQGMYRPVVMNTPLPPPVPAAPVASKKPVAKKPAAKPVAKPIAKPVAKPVAKPMGFTALAKKNSPTGARSGR